MTCGQGQRSRERTCVNLGFLDLDCAGPASDTETCIEGVSNHSMNGRLGEYVVL